jgi:hypothetical protein
MKRKVLLVLILAALVAGGAFAQRVGDTVQVGGKDYRVDEVRNDGYLGLRPAPTIDGTWEGFRGASVFTIAGTTGIWTHISPSTPMVAYWQDAIQKGYLKVGNEYFRNLRKTGDSTWAGQFFAVYGNGTVATQTKWLDMTMTLSTDGRTLKNNYGDIYTKRQ